MSAFVHPAAAAAATEGSTAVPALAAALLLTETRSGAVGAMDVGAGGAAARAGSGLAIGGYSRGGAGSYSASRFGIEMSSKAIVPSLF